MSPAPLLASGAYAMPEFCRRLTETTGTVHTTTGPLRDYPIFLSTPSPDPAHIRRLAASAFGATWVRDGNKLVLTPVPVDMAELVSAFKVRFDAATKDQPIIRTLPAKELARMQVGDIVRYGSPPNPLIRPFPREMAKLAASGTVSVRRMGTNIFEFRLELPNHQSGPFSGTEGSLEIRNVPAPVLEGLTPVLNQTALDATGAMALRTFAIDPLSLGIDWSHLDRRDLIGEVANLTLGKFAQVLNRELVVALPDFTLFSATAFRQGTNSVQDILNSLSIAVDWRLDGATLVGALPLEERRSSTQAKRDVLGRFVTNAGINGAVSVNGLTDYVANQRPGASDSWSDAMMLVLAGTVLDQSYIGDYPYNFRWAVRLSNNDWSLLKGGQPFAGNLLSLPAQRYLGDIVLRSRSRMMNDQPETARWQSLAPADLLLTPKVTEEIVLVESGTFGERPSLVSECAANFDRRTKALGRAPIYRPARRIKLQLTIASPADEAKIETGFAEIRIAPGTAAVAWQQLPEPFREEFERILNAPRQSESGGNPPPPLR